ncbi:MAG: hypothetical protein GXP40_06120 [Chloroflexi bacterium]|nr:hypothetical protein [Chloroflexota bacterium]
MPNHPSRPFSVTLLALGVLSLTTLNGVRFGAALIDWKLLDSIMPRPGPLYIAATGLIWTLGGLTVYTGLWLGRKWSRPAALIASVLYAAYYWFDRLTFRSSVPSANQPFALAATIVCLLFVITALSLPGSRKFFRQREQHDRQPKDQTSP